MILLICSKFGYDFHYIGAHNPVACEKMNLPNVLNNALPTSPDWALWMIKLAYTHPIAYVMLGIIGVIIVALLIERFISRYIIIKKRST